MEKCDINILPSSFRELALAALEQEKNNVYYPVQFLITGNIVFKEVTSWENYRKIINSLKSILENDFWNRKPVSVLENGILKFKAEISLLEVKEWINLFGSLKNLKDSEGIKTMRHNAECSLSCSLYFVKDRKGYFARSGHKAMNP